MGLQKPFKRTARQLVTGAYVGDGNQAYVCHPKFAENPHSYVRGFLLIQKDFQELMDYIEPSDDNAQCYSYRLHQLLLRACVEVEANFKAILRENGYSKSNQLNQSDYVKIEESHFLSGFKIHMPFWSGDGSIRQPFEAWNAQGSLPWYRAYNATKHDRADKFGEANLENLSLAMCGLIALLSAQFITEDFSGSPDYYVSDSPTPFETAIGGLFGVEFPGNWPSHECYDFDWKQLKHLSDPFEKFDYNKP